MNPGVVIWRGAEVLKKYREKLSRNMDRVGVTLQREVVQSFGNPPPYPEGGATTVEGNRISAKRWRRMHHSEPGDPPFVQTGMLRRSINYNVDGTKLLLGSTLKPQGSDHSYAWLLEWGSSIMAARPYLRPAVRRNKSLIVRMLCGKD